MQLRKPRIRPPGDDGGDQGGENLSQRAHDLLQAVLVLLGGALDRLLGDALDARHRYEIIVKLGHGVADDDLELARLGKGALGGLDFLDPGHIRLGRVVEHKAHPGDAVRHRRNVLFAADGRQQLFCVLLVLAHENILLRLVPHVQKSEHVQIGFRSGASIAFRTKKSIETRKNMRDTRHFQSMAQTALLQFGRIHCIIGSNI